MAVVARSTGKRASPYDALEQITNELLRGDVRVLDLSEESLVVTSSDLERLAPEGVPALVHDIVRQVERYGTPGAGPVDVGVAITFMADPRVDDVGDVPDEPEALARQAPAGGAIVTVAAASRLPGFDRESPALRTFDDSANLVRAFVIPPATKPRSTDRGPGFVASGR